MQFTGAPMALTRCSAIGAVAVRMALQPPAVSDQPFRTFSRPNRPEIKLPVFNKPLTWPLAVRAGMRGIGFGTPLLKKPDILSLIHI